MGACSGDCGPARQGGETSESDAESQLTSADFRCFQTKFVAADPYADCNADGQRTVADYGSAPALARQRSRTGRVSQTRTV